MAYTIKEAAKISGIGPHTIRFYDRQGLLPFMERKPGEIRKFSDLDMECLAIISMLKATGLTIKGIKRYLDLCVLGDDALDKRLEFMQKHKAEVERQMEEYKKFMQLVGYKIWYYETAIKAGTEYVHDQYYETYGISPQERYAHEIE